MSDTFDLVVIGAGASGEAAAFYARKRAASVAIVERDLFGGTCAFWGCMPSKALLHAAAVRACGGELTWAEASAFRDRTIAREDGRAYPDDSGHVKRLEEAGAVPVRGAARFTAPGEIEVAHDGGTRALAARDVVIAVGSVGKVPPLPGLEEAGYWRDREGTALRALPESIVLIGAGPSGVELAQVYARFGVRTTIVSPRQVHPTDHPRSSARIAEILRADGVDVREHARATRVRPRAGAGGRHVVELADGSAVEAEVIELNAGRTAKPALSALALDRAGIRHEGGDFLEVGEDLRAADHHFAVGDCVDRELSTHLGHYEGETAVRIALGDPVRADFRATPRCVYIEDPTAAVGLRVDEARERGIDAYEETADLAATAKGWVGEGKGHVTIVVDRKARTLAGAFIAGPGADEAIHLAVLAIKQRTPLDALADTVTAFPTTARVLGGLFAKAAFDLR